MLETDMGGVKDPAYRLANGIGALVVGIADAKVIC